MRPPALQTCSRVAVWVNRGYLGRTRASRSTVLRALAIATGGALFACATPAFGANARPDANFGFFPREPVSGQTVQFVSYACDPDGKLAEQAWDLDGDGSFDDALGSRPFTSFTEGLHGVALRVTNKQGVTARRSRVIDVGQGPVDYVLPEPFEPPLLSPFPFVRLSGTVIGPRTRISVLSVRAPVCSRVTILCRGEGCPWRRRTKLARRGPTRFRDIQRRIFAGATIKVLVTKRDRIGKYTRFRLRANRAPKRRDRCLRFGSTRGIPCPSD
jgi:hypothetical protein